MLAIFEITVDDIQDLFNMSSGETLPDEPTMGDGIDKSQEDHDATRP